MNFCTKCGATLQEAHQFCWHCGTKAEAPEPSRSTAISRFFRAVPRPEAPRTLKKFGQTFGLDPRVAFLTLVIDMMLNAGDLASMGVLLPFSVLAGIVLGYIVYKAQINWYGDDPESARIKAVILGLLTAIPTPIPEVLYIPAGVIGWLHTFRKKESHP